MKFFIVTLLALALALVGCAGSAESASDVVEVVKDPRTGQEIFRRETRSSTSAELPPNAAGPTTMSTNGDGATSIELPGTHAKPLAAYGIEQRQLIFFGGGSLLVVVAGLAWWWGQRMLSASMLVAGLTLFAAQKWIDVAAGPIAVTFVLVMIAGVAWWVCNIYRNGRANASAVKSWLKLTREGQSMAAGAALREAPLVRKVKP